MNTNESSSNSKRSEQTVPDPNVKIHWAPSDLDQELDALKSRNWISEDLIKFSEKHWHCTREQAVERLLAGNTNSV